MGQTHSTRDSVGLGYSNPSVWVIMIGIWVPRLEIVSAVCTIINYLVISICKASVGVDSFGKHWMMPSNGTLYSGARYSKMVCQLQLAIKVISCRTHVHIHSYTEQHVYCM